MYIYIYIYTYTNIYIYIYIYIYIIYIKLNNATQKKKQIKTRSKDSIECIAVLSAGTIFAIRQRLALKRDY